MAGFSKQKRQEFVDHYLAATGRNLFVADEFVSWLSKQKNHEAYSWFFGQSDKEAAFQFRVQKARAMVNGLRISVKTSTAPQQGTSVKVVTREFPAFVSPVAGRRNGGGYEPFDINDPASVAELRAQGIRSLKSWLQRYSGVFESEGVDISAIRRLVDEEEKGRLLRSA